MDEDARVIRIRGKEKYGFRVKDSEQREVPIPDDLLVELKTWKQQHGSKGLVLSTNGGRPNRKLLRTLKRTAKNAKLNCGRCAGCKGRNQECQEWTPHRSRRTYATTLLRNGFDLRTVQAYMGHADLDSTMRYLRPAASGEMRAKLNRVKWRRAENQSARSATLQSRTSLRAGRGAARRHRAGSRSADAMCSETLKARAGSAPPRQSCMALLEAIRVSHHSTAAISHRKCFAGKPARSVTRQHSPGRLRLQKGYPQSGGGFH